MDIEIHIEKLVLHGFAPSDKHRIAAAVQEELERLIKARGAPAGSGSGFHRAQLAGGSFNVRPGERADTIGARIGQAVYEVLVGNQEA